VKYLLKVLFISCLIFPNDLVWAQTEPCFEADILKGCVPFTVNMADCSGADADLIFYDYGEGPTTATSHTYQNAGIYSIKQLINSGNGGKELLKTDYIEAIERLPINVDITVCEERKVQVSIKDEYYAEYLIDFGDGTSQTVSGLNDVTHTYSDENQKTITVSGFFSSQSSSCAEITRTITPIGSIDTADLTLVELNSSTTATLHFSLASGINYQLEQSINGGSFSVVTNLIDVSTHTLSNLNTQTETSVFRITAISPCGGQNSSSPEINTTFLEVDVQNGVNELRWTKSELANFDRFQILRNGVEIASTSQADITILLDTDIECNKEYCYQIIGYANAEQTQSISQTVCVKANIEADLEPITNIIASVNEDNQVVLSWDLPDSTTSIEELQILRISDSTDSLELVIPSAETYIDLNSFASNSQYCYQVTYQDVCGNKAETSQLVCPIFLTGEQSDTQADLNWTECNFLGDKTNTDTTLADEVVYIVEKLDEEGNIFSEGATTELNFLDTFGDDDAQTITYRIKVCTSDSIPVCVYSNIYTVVLSSYLKIPTAFSPNGDGLNDTFGVVGRFLVEMDMEIYNLWGNPIFKGTGTEIRWDGSVNGKEAPQATYSYYITAKDKRGRIFKQTGHIVLVK
jgi:gliding motility-associated-like protein